MAEDSKGFKPPPEIDSSAAWDRLEDQLKYYSGKSGHCQTMYKRIKLAQITISAAIPILVFMPLGDAAKFIVAGAGVVIALLEGLLLLNQYPELWVKYRATAEGLKRERSLLLAGAGDYRDKSTADALRLLAERTETLIAEENRQWTETQQKALQALVDAQAFVKSQMDATAKGS